MTTRDLVFIGEVFNCIIDTPEAIYLEVVMANMLCCKVEINGMNN